MSATAIWLFNVYILEASIIYSAMLASDTTAVVVCRWMTDCMRRAIWVDQHLTGVRPRMTTSTGWGPSTLSQGSGPISPTALSVPGTLLSVEALLAQ